MNRPREQKLFYSVALNFSRRPGGRTEADGPHSGEALRRRLAQTLRHFDGRLMVDLDGTAGMGWSFLDEAFGGLIRVEGFSLAELDARLVFKARHDPSYILSIRDCMASAAR